MQTLILTAIGQDRAGLVAALAEVVRFHGGNWEHAEMAELGGTFAGVVQVSIPAGRVDAFIADLDTVDTDLDVQVRLAAPTVTNVATLRIDLVADDRPGIVDEISRALAALGVSIHRLDTNTAPAPMAGGQLFTLGADVVVPDATTPAEVRAALERLSHELMVDLTIT